MSADLKPCPFCNAQPYEADPTNFPGGYEHPWEHKGCILDGYHIENSSAWNRRAPTDAEERGRLKGLEEAARLTALPQSPVGELVGELKCGTSILRVEHPHLDKLALAACLEKAATALLSLQAENERLKHELKSARLMG